MRARLIKPNQATNPAYDADEEREAKESGEFYPHKPEIVLPVGHEFESPYAWMYCVRGFRKGKPVAVPADEECRERVLKHNTDSNPQGVARIKSLLQNPPENADEAVHIRQTALAWGIIGRGAEDPADDLLATPGVASGADSVGDGDDTVEGTAPDLVVGGVQVEGRGKDRVANDVTRETQQTATVPGAETDSLESETQQTATVDEESTPPQETATAAEPPNKIVPVTGE